jgi:hypothetical protein
MWQFAGSNKTLPLSLKAMPPFLLTGALPDEGRTKRVFKSAASAIIFPIAAPVV